MLWKIAKATMEDFCLKIENLASCTSDSGCDVKSMCVNHARDYDIAWDRCSCHMLTKACEVGFEMAADAAKSKNQLVRKLIRLVIKVIERMNKSSTWRAKLEDIQVSMLPDRNDSINVELKTRQVSAEDLLQVTKVTGREVLNALVSRHFDRVWNTNTSDPSFFREASIALLPTYRNAKHLDMMRLMSGDEKGVPAKSTSTAPTPATDVQRRRTETWAEIRRRAVTVATARLAEREGSDEIRAAKRARLVASESDTGTAPKTASSSSARWAAFVDDEEEAKAGETMSPEMVAEKEVEEELKRFHAFKVRAADCQPREGLKYSGNRDRLSFTNLRAVAQQVFGNQASAAQIERDFGGAGQLLSARRSRMDAYYVKIMLPSQLR